MRELTYKQLQREVKGLNYQQEADLMRSMSFKQAKVLAEEWTAEDGLDPSDSWHYPYKPSEVGTVAQTLFRLVQEGRVTTLKGLKAQYDRWAQGKKGV